MAAVRDGRLGLWLAFEPAQQAEYPLISLIAAAQDGTEQDCRDDQRDDAIDDGQGYPDRGMHVTARRDQPAARRHRQPVPATLTTTLVPQRHQGSSGNWTL